MNYQFYMHFEIKILYINPTNFIPDGFANFCFKKSFIPKLPFFYCIDTCGNGISENFVTTSIL